MAQMALLPGTTSFPDPGNWNPLANQVEVIGPGNTAANGNITGGGYATDVNLNPTFPVPVSIVTTFPTQNQVTRWGPNTQVPGTIIAGCGNTGPYYPALNSRVGGGNNPGLVGGNTGAGAAGASGPNGGGSPGNGTGNTPPSAGGAANGGLTPAQTTPGAMGNSVVVWPLVNIGIGGGGAGGPSGQRGGNGGMYGGGGGYAGAGSTNVGTLPGYGVIVVTWTTLSGPEPTGQIIG